MVPYHWLGSTGIIGLDAQAWFPEVSVCLSIFLLLRRSSVGMMTTSVTRIIITSATTTPTIMSTLSPLTITSPTVDISLVAAPLVCTIVGFDDGGSDGGCDDCGGMSFAGSGRGSCHTRTRELICIWRKNYMDLEIQNGLHYWSMPLFCNHLFGQLDCIAVRRIKCIWHTTSVHIGTSKCTAHHISLPTICVMHTFLFTVWLIQKGGGGYHIK